MNSCHQNIHKGTHAQTQTTKCRKCLASKSERKTCMENGRWEQTMKRKQAGKRRKNVKENEPANELSDIPMQQWTNWCMKREKCNRLQHSTFEIQKFKYGNFHHNWNCFFFVALPTFCTIETRTRSLTLAHTGEIDEIPLERGTQKTPHRMFVLYVSACVFGANRTGSMGPKRVSAHPYLLRCTLKITKQHLY